VPCPPTAGGPYLYAGAAACTASATLTTNGTTTDTESGTFVFADAAAWSASGISMAGTYTTASTAMFSNTATWSFSSTGAINAAAFNPVLVGAGASIGTVHGFNFNPHLSDASAGLAATEFDSLNVTMTTDATYTGTLALGIGLRVSGPTISGTHPLTEWDGVRIGGATNGNGLTSGTVTNVGLQTASATAAAGSGETINNYTIECQTPTGSGTGTTNNRCLFITGNGGTGGGGTTTNYAIYDASTAQVYFAGQTVVGAVGYTNALAFAVTNTWTGSGPDFIDFLGTYNGSSNGPLAGINATTKFTPTGSPITIAELQALPVLEGSSLALTNVQGVVSSIRFDSGFTGTVANWQAFLAFIDTGGTGTYLATNWRGFEVDAVTNGQGQTSGTITNTGFYAFSFTAAAGALGTVINQAAFLNVGSGSSAGTTNYGLRITGNGGASATANWAIYSDSTAKSQIGGQLNVGANSTDYLLLTGGASGATINTNGGSLTLQANATNALAFSSAGAWTGYNMGAGAGNGAICGATGILTTGGAITYSAGAPCAGSAPLASPTFTGTVTFPDTTTVTASGHSAVTSPSLIGGSATSQTLTIESTTGVGTSDSIVFKTGSQATALTITTGGIVEVAGVGSASAPSFSVGNATTGLYSVSTTGFGITVNGAVQLNFGITTSGTWFANASFQMLTNGAIYGQGANSFDLSSVAATATVPTLIPNRAATTSGVGAQASGNVSIIASGTEMIRATSTTIALFGIANAATTSAMCYNTSTGVVTYDGTIGTCTVSDENLKNIGPSIDHALERVLSIKGFYFTYKNPSIYGDGMQIGVGAQTVERAFPELVNTDSQGIKSVAYEKLAAPIIESLREVDVRLRMLEHANDNHHRKLRRAG